MGAVMLLARSAFGALPPMAWAVVAALLFGAWQYHRANGEAAQREAARTEAAAEQFARNEKIVAASVRHEDARAVRARQTEQIVKEVDRVVEVPRYRDVCLDPDGMRLVAAAIDGTPVDTGQPASGLPAAAAPR